MEAIETRGRKTKFNPDFLSGSSWVFPKKKANSVRVKLSKMKATHPHLHYKTWIKDKMVYVLKIV